MENDKIKISIYTPPEKIEEIVFTEKQRQEYYIMFHELLEKKELEKTSLMEHVILLTNQVNELTKEIKK